MNQPPESRLSLGAERSCVQAFEIQGSEGLHGLWKRVERKAAVPWCVVRGDCGDAKSQPCPVSYETIMARLFAPPLGVVGIWCKFSKYALAAYYWHLETLRVREIDEPGYFSERKHEILCTEFPSTMSAGVGWLTGITLSLQRRLVKEITEVCEKWKILLKMCQLWVFHP